MKGVRQRLVSRRLRMWDLQGGPTWLERRTAGRPLLVALLHGSALAAVLALIDQPVGQHWTGPLAIVVYSTLVYLRGRELHAALRLYPPTCDQAEPEVNEIGPAQEPKHPALRAVYWREEILGVVLWLRGEGWDDNLDPDVLHRFLDLDRTKAEGHLAHLAEQGYLHRRPDGRFDLTQPGEEEGRRITEGHRAVPPPTTGPCGPECWCSTSPMEASRCAPAPQG